MSGCISSKLEIATEKIKSCIFSKCITVFRPCKTIIPAAIFIRTHISLLLKGFSNIYY